MRVRYTRQAQREIASIYDYIAKSNPAAAQRVEDYIRAAIDRLGTFPRLGVTTDAEGVRRLPIGRYPYSVFYFLDLSAGEIPILHVVHGARLRDLNKPP